MTKCHPVVKPRGDFVSSEQQLSNNDALTYVPIYVCFLGLKFP